MIEKMQDLILSLNEELEANRVEAEEIRILLLNHEPILKRSDINKLDRKRIEQELDEAHEAYRQMNKSE
jgi:hypothetical protein